MLTAEQLQARLGRVTSSVVDALYVTRKDKKESADRKKLRYRLALERITGISQEEARSNPDIDRGNELEPQARIAWEMSTGQLVQESDFIPHPELMAGCSPDGLVGEDGVIEIKAPRAYNHAETLEAMVVPDDYVPQVVHLLWVTNRQWVDFVSFCPQMPPALQLAVIRYHRKEDEMAAHEVLVRQFLSDVEGTVARINRLQENR